MDRLFCLQNGVWKIEKMNRKIRCFCTTYKYSVENTQLLKLQGQQIKKLIKIEKITLFSAQEYNGPRIY